MSVWITVFTELAGSLKLMGTMRILLDPESMTLSENVSILKQLLLELWNT